MWFIRASAGALPGFSFKTSSSGNCSTPFGLTFIVLTSLITFDRMPYQRQSLINCVATLGRSGPTAAGTGQPGTSSTEVGALPGLAISAD